MQWLLFFNQFVRFTSCDGEFSALRSTMELQIPHGFLKRSVLKVLEMINKSQHRRFQSKSRRYWKFKIAVFLMFNVWELQHKNDSLMYIHIYIYEILCQNVTTFYQEELASLFQVRKNWKRAGIQSVTFRVAVHRWQSYKSCMATCSSFHQTWSFAFLRQCPFVKILSSESASQLF